jgi:WD40 repeat protein
MLATGTTGRNSVVKIWDTATLRELRSLSGFWNAVTALKFSSDSSLLAISTYQGRFSLWDVETGQELITLGDNSRGDARINDLAFSPDGTLLAGACDDGYVRIWKAARPERAGPSR